MFELRKQNYPTNGDNDRMFMETHCVLKNRGCHSQNHKGDEGLPKGVVLTFP